MVSVKIEESTGFSLAKNEYRLGSFTEHCRLAAEGV